MLNRLNKYKVIKKIRSVLCYIKNYKRSRIELENKNKELLERLDWFIAHTDITTLKPATGYLRKEQLELVNFADVFFNEISELKIHPFLIAGSLIGAYRHKGFVPWDDDLDFGLIREEYDALIEYCKKNYHVEIYDGKWSEYNTDVHLDRMNKLVTSHPNEYILDIWVDQLQLMKGTSCIDRMCIDFWAYDFYNNDYDINEHLDYLKTVDRKRREIDYVDKIIEYFHEERIENKNISNNPTEIFFSGIDNLDGYLRADRTKNWIKTEDTLPFKKSKFENTEYYVPSNMERWLEHEYGDYMSFPPEVGKAPHHGYKDIYLTKHYPTVEFYLIDAFEIYHFLPLYNYFEKNGIYSAFIAEKPENENAWFDYHTAIEILEAKGVRYKSKPNYDSDVVFTTQDEYLVEKYKGKKVNLCYGVGLADYYFCEDIRSINKFDLKIIHGKISCDIIKSKNQKIELIQAGYLKYSKWGDKKGENELKDIKNEIDGMNADNKDVIIYFPTWSDYSSIQEYAPVIEGLKRKYFIISKPHHCTFRLESEKNNLEALYKISDIVLDGNYQFEEIAHLGKIAICDAISGAATEIPFLNKNIRLVLLYSPNKEKNKFKSFIDQYALCVHSYDKLEDAVDMIDEEDIYLPYRKSLINDIYSPREEEALEEIKQYIKKIK